jgi:hypothetical protein
MTLKLVDPEVQGEAGEGVEELMREALVATRRLRRAMLVVALNDDSANDSGTLGAVDAFVEMLSFQVEGR